MMHTLSPGENTGRTWGQRAVLAVNLMLIVISLVSAFVLWSVYGRAASINRVVLDRSLTAVGDAEPGERVLNVLLVGSDSSVGLDDDDPIQIGRQGERFGDVIIVAHIDERTDDIALLSFPRDLWVDIGDTGRPGRINRAFVNGGPSLLIETIEREFDIPIHHYVNVDFLGFRGLVSAIDSVDVWFDTPARDWNVTAQPVPRTQTGFKVSTAGCHSLDPEAALAYVRSRYYQTQGDDGQWRTDPTADLGRIRRQQDFLRRAIKRSIELGARNPFVLRDLVDTALEHVAIDHELTPQFVVDLGGTFGSFDPANLETYSFPSVAAEVGNSQVLMPRMDDAEPVLELFRGAPFDDPSTIGLSVVFADEVASEVRRATLRPLQGHGLRPVVTEDSELDTGGKVIVRHGPDGVHAARVVADLVGPDVVLEQHQWLLGRSVELAIGPEVEQPTQADADRLAMVSEDELDLADVESVDDVATPVDPDGAVDTSIEAKLSAQQECG